MLYCVGIAIYGSPLQLHCERRPRRPSATRAMLSRMTDAAGPRRRRVIVFGASFWKIGSSVQTRVCAYRPPPTAHRPPPKHSRFVQKKQPWPAVVSVTR